MSRVALVTGANQGLGFALVKRLLQTFTESDAVYLTARSEERGRAATAQLEAAGLHPRFALMDVTDAAHVEDGFAELAAENGGVDVVIHNAAARISPDRAIGAQVRGFVETNNLGTTRVLRALRGRLRARARVVVVASSFGSLSHLDSKLHPLFHGPDVDLESLDAVMRRYIDVVERGAAADEGWPDWINVPSKIGQVAAMRTFAAEIAGRDGILVNAACPGLVDTDASRPWFADMSDAQSPDEAAVDVVWLATLPAGTTRPYGELVRKRGVLPFTVTT